MEETREERIRRLSEEFTKLLEEKFPERGSTIEEIERVTEEIGQEIERRIEENATQQEGSGYVGNTAVCACGQKARFVRRSEKGWLTMHGLLVISRAYYYCHHCRQGFAPLDAALCLDRESTSLRVRDKIARIAAMAPFERGANELRALCGVEVSAKTFERVAERVGAAIGEEAHRIEQAILSGQVSSPERAPERLYVTLDGAMLAVDGRWRECKLGAVYEADVREDETVLARDIEHVGTLGDSERIGDKVYALAFRRGVERATEVVVLGDGAKWIWNRTQEHFPGCIEIVDFYHASEHLGAIAHARWGVENPRASQWLEERKLDLLEGRFERVMKSLRRWQPDEPEAVKIRQDNLGYFERNRERMRYDVFRAQGMHIGSGVAESACKNLAHARLKQAGMRWTEKGAESILQLRRMWLDVPEADFAPYARAA